jgi:hypothetical protein
MYLMKLRVWNYKINSQTIQKNLTTKEFFFNLQSFYVFDYLKFGNQRSRKRIFFN